MMAMHQHEMKEERNKCTPAEFSKQDEDDVNPSSIGKYDIICGRDSSAFNNIGNRRFRVTISLHVHRYLSAPTRKEKKVIIQGVFDLLTKRVGARFLRRKPKGSNNHEFIVLGDREVRNKIQHALRDMAALQLEECTSSEEIRRRRGRSNSGGSSSSNSSSNHDSSNSYEDHDHSLRRRHFFNRSSTEEVTRQETTALGMFSNEEQDVHYEELHSHHQPQCHKNALDFSCCWEIDHLLLMAMHDPEVPVTTTKPPPILDDKFIDHK